jgi:predicted 3-demethylubiquinone-9 3-methyltransferase (glyoxalase superfamily)
LRDLAARPVPLPTRHGSCDANGLTQPEKSTPLMSEAQKISPFLWFNDQAEEAATYYVSVFKDSKIVDIARNVEGKPGAKQPAMVVTFQLQGRQYFAFNGGPSFAFTEAISLVVSCDSQAEVDELWATLSEGGEQRECGWLKDKFGLFWQIIPAVFFKWVSDPDSAKVQRVMAAMMKLKKMDIARLEAAYAGK